MIESCKISLLHEIYTVIAISVTINCVDFGHIMVANMIEFKFSRISRVIAVLSRYDPVLLLK